MYLVAIAWLYVAVMMSVAEAMHSQGTVLGAIVTFVFYGLLPVSLVMYILGTPSRKKARKAREAAEAAEAAAAASAEPDAGGQPPGAAEPASVAPVGKEH